MSFLLVRIENLLAELCDRCLSRPPRAYTTLAPVWVLPMVRKAENPAARGR